MADSIAPDLCLQLELQTLFIRSMILGLYSTIRDMPLNTHYNNDRNLGGWSGEQQSGLGIINLLSFFGHPGVPHLLVNHPNFRTPVATE